MKTHSTIGLVLKGYPRLSETFISQEILALEQLGFDFHIISLRHPTDKAVHPVNAEISAPVSYLPEYVHQEPWRVFKAWWRVRKLAGYRKARAIFIHDLKRDFTRNRFRRFAQALVIAAEFRHIAACFYAHFLHTPTSATRYAAIITGIPFAISAHAKDIWTSPDWEISEKLQDCQWLTTCTAGGRDHLQKLSDNPNKINLVYHGLDLARFPPANPNRAARLGDDVKNPVRFISVGRAVAKKGFDTLLDALAQLPRDLQWQWTHIGGGPLLGQLKHQAEKLGVAARCEFRGAMDQRDVIAAYQQSDLFVLPCRIDSNGDRDGLPNVIVEAQSQRLPVISSPISGIPELISDEQNGLLVEPDNAKNLAAAITRLATNPKLRFKLGTHGENRVRSNFNHLTTIGELAELMGELINNANDKKKAPTL